MSTAESMTIETAAARLAGLIKESEEWKEFQRVHERFEQHEEVSRMLGEYQQLAAQVQGAHSRGEETAGGMRRLEQLQVNIQQVPVFQEREKAADAMLGVLSQANAAITAGLGIDFAANAQPHHHHHHNGGCCGGDGGCSHG
jgi:cell fate (sporulation/competence/biofilm development) regulator YlbF (YheA/YmcA/DUF963 family)